MGRKTPIQSLMEESMLTHKKGLELSLSLQLGNIKFDKDNLFWSIFDIPIHNIWFESVQAKSKRKRGNIVKKK